MVMFLPCHHIFSNGFCTILHQWTHPHHRQPAPVAWILTPRRPEPQGFTHGAKMFQGVWPSHGILVQMGIKMGIKPSPHLWFRNPFTLIDPCECSHVLSALAHCLLPSTALMAADLTDAASEESPREVRHVQRCT